MQSYFVANRGYKLHPAFNNSNTSLPFPFASTFGDFCFTALQTLKKLSTEDAVKQHVAAACLGNRQ